MKKKLLHLFFAVRNSWPIWYYVLNARARFLYKHTPQTLSPLQSRILDDLQKDGIAFSSLDEFFPDEPVLETLQRWEKGHREEADAISKKTFLKSYWNMPLAFEASNPFCTLSIRKDVLAIVNAYDKMFRMLHHVHLARTVPVGNATPVFSQNWHRDPEEKRMVKFFVYLSDVKEENGPFTYLRSSNFGAQKYGHLFPQDVPLGVYPDTEKLMSSIDPTDIVTATGKAGTIIFCDTVGFHRGGYTQSGERVMFTAFYPSVWWTEQKRYKLPPSSKRSEYTPAQAYALGLM